MVRIAAFILSLIGSLTLLGSAAIAQPGNSYYNVTLAQPTVTRTVVRDMLVTCDNAVCTAGQGTSRPEFVCASIARKFGPVTSFRAGNETLDGEGLAKCNAKADTTKIARR